MKKQILQSSVLILIVLTTSFTKTNAQWKLVGNAGTDPLTNFVGTTDNVALIFRTKNMERMRIQNGGRIGIGTTTPSARLNVVSSDIVSLGNPGMLMLGNVTGANMTMDYDVIQARNNGSASSIWLNYYGGATYLGPSSAVQISSDGHLTTLNPAGIAGTYNSLYALNINANSSLGGINVTDPVDNYALFCAKSGLDAGVYVSKASTTTATPCVEGYSSGSAGGVEGYSNTGIGVYGSSTSNFGLYGYSSTGTGVYGVSYASSADNGYAGQFIANNFRGIYVQSATGWIAGYFNGDVYTTGSYTGSDAKLKKNITDVNDAMSIINKLQPKYYEFRNDGNYAKMNLPKGNHFGLIAQDVEKVLPNLVRDMDFETKDAQPKVISKDGKEIAQTQSQSKSEEIDFKAVNYTELIPIIIKGMQEQQATIDKQQEQINQLVQLLQNQNVTNSSNSSDVKSVALSNAYVMQNAPNPFTQNTVVKCFVPTTVKQAQLIVFNLSGQSIKTYPLTNGMNNVNIAAGSLPAGQYTYSLIADGKKVDSKNMNLTK